MNRLKGFGPLAVLALAFGVIVLPNVLAGERAVQGTGDVFELVPNPGGTPPVKDGDAVEGATASITRNTKGVTINIHTVGLDPNHAYTVWVIEVNCGAPVCRPVRLAGHIVGASGVGNFSGRLDLNDDPSKPVQDPFGGEFHCIITDHGPIDPKDLPGAIKTPLPPFAPDGTQNWEQVVIFNP